MARRPGGEAAIRSRLAASPGLSDAEAHTLAGFLDAESHLAVIPNNGGATWRCECSVNLRDDDREILVSYRARTPRIKLERLHGGASADYRAAVVRRLRGLLQTA
jgi:hypothetical protein